MIPKFSDEAAATVSIDPRDVIRVGRGEFSDSKSETEGEMVLFAVDGYAPTTGSSRAKATEKPAGKRRSR